MRLHKEQEIKILQKLFNQRKESFEIFTKENRPELATHGKKREMEVIVSYLPQQLSDEELHAIVQASITETGLFIKDMGKVIGMVKKGSRTS